MLTPLLILCLVQSITEFLPVSSTAHMILIDRWIESPQNDLLLHVGLHLGTFLAIVVFYLRTLINIIIHFIKGIFVVAHRKNAFYLLGGYILCATLPALILGFFLKPYMNSLHNNLFLIGVCSILFGGLLAYVDHYNNQDKDDVTFLNALMIGFGQLFAFLPGGSRLGTTLTVARIFGFSRSKAFEFSMLLSLPVVLGAVSLTSIDAMKQGCFHLTHDFLLILTLTFSLSLLVLSFVSKFIDRIGFVPFGIYRVILGIILILGSMF